MGCALHRYCIHYNPGFLGMLSLHVGVHVEIWHILRLLPSRESGNAIWRSFILSELFAALLDEIDNEQD